ncbi:MAG: carboxypeptidase regulatory-like domain-containing protein [Candidatus Micrarchaeota archaeon]
MGIGQFFSNGYTAAEDKFFDFCDFLEDKGIPIYGYTNFLEEKGIPAFPVTVALLIVILSLIGWLFFFNSGSATVLALSLHDDAGQTLSGVNVLVTDSASGQTLFSGKKNHGDLIELKGVAAGAELAIAASKEGYENSSAKIKVNNSRIDTPLQFNRIIQSIAARFRLIDGESGRPISGAQVTLRWGSNFVRSDVTDSNGNFQALGIPANEDVRIEVKADNYEELQQTFKFSAGSVPTISLVPKSTASFGQANLIVNTFDKQSKSPLSDVLLKIVNPQTNQSFAEARTVNGQFVLDLPKGTVFKIICQKAGYSILATEEQTLRSDPQTINLELEQGGTKLGVTVYSLDSNAEMFNATVGLYDSQANLIDEKTTPYAGRVEFVNLASDQNYFVTAFKETFLPQTVEFTPFDTSDIKLYLPGQSPENTGTLNIIVTDSTGFASPGASLNYFESVAGRKFPLGLPAKTTEYDGFATAIMPANITILAEAQKGVEFGQGTILMVANKDNSLPIKMQPLDTAKLLRVLNEDSNPFGPGRVLIKSLNSVKLLDANLTEMGTALFDARTYKIVDITITAPDGNTFNQQANVEGIKEIVVRWIKSGSQELAPNIQFLGTVDAGGQPVSGIKPNTDYWLSFQVNWPAGDYRGGIHVRLGSDQVKFVESDVAGITGFDAGGVTSFFYGRSYTAFPSPGNEALDFGNAGKAGSLNKWLELYWDKPTGSSLIKVKVQLKEGAGPTSIPVHFRAWSIVSDQYFRQPEDSELGAHKFTPAKTGLYAKTLDDEVSLFSGEGQCNNGVCADFGFVSQEDGRVSPKNFTALKGRIYALEVTVRSKTDQVILVNAQTSTADPHLFFMGAEVQTFTNFLDFNDSQETQIEVNDVHALPNQSRTVRLYFKAVQTGNASITAHVIGDDAVINQDFFFNVFESGQMQMTILPATINVGDPFTITLADLNNSRIINDAAIRLRDSKGQIALSTVGNNQKDNGQDGRYYFKNALTAGTYDVTATAFGFAPANAQISVNQGGLLKLPEEIAVKIAQGQTTNQVTVSIQNVSQFEINDLIVEIQKPDNWPIELDAQGEAVSSLSARQSGKLDVTAVFLGDTNAILTGNADLIVHGTVGSNGYETSAKTRLVVTYNQPLDVNCIVFNPSQLTVFLTANPPFNQFESSYYPYGSGTTSPAGSTGSYTGYGSSSFPYNSNYPYNSGSGGYQQAPYYPQLTQQQYYANPGAYNANYTPQYTYANNPPGQSAGSATNPLGTTNYQPYYNSQPNSPNYNNYNYTGGQYNGTGNIYSPSYSNYNQTQQQAEIQVTNNCGVAFNFTGQVIPKSGTKDSGIEIQTPGFAIQPNETVSTTVSVVNNMNRFLPRPQVENFDILFSNPYTKRLPLTVVLWDSRFSIAAPDRIDLYLSQGSRGEPVITSSPLFLRNIGSDNIQQLDVQVGGDSYTGSANIRVVPNGMVPLIAPGQVVFPPKIVVAEASGGVTKGELVHSFLTVSGLINGQYYQLKTIDVWVHISALDCLVLSPVDDLLFSNPESAFGVIDKKVRIRNTCEEPVRVVGLEPATAGPNPLALVPVSTNLLNRDFEAEFLIRLVKQGDYKNPNMGIAAGGLLQTTNKFISSNRLQAQFEIGASAVTTGLASNPYTIDVCQEEGVAKGSKEATSFPKLSKSPECTKGYCDSVLASEFLATKLRDKMNQVQLAITEGGSELSNFKGCVNTAPNKACTFTELGVTPEQFDLFLVNDQLTPNLLQKTIAETGPAELQAYAVNYCFGTPQCEVKAIAQTGFPNLLYLSDAFRGCGRYRVTINGAVFASQSQMRNTGFVMSINVTQRLLTPECTNQIENVSNFLPVDKGLTGDNAFDAWPGVVETESRLMEVGHAFANELFDGQEGRVFESANGNKIILRYGEVTGGIIKLEMDPTSSTDQPKTIIATINQALDTKKIQLASVELQSEDNRVPNANAPANPPNPPANSPATTGSNTTPNPGFTQPISRGLPEEAAAAVSALKKQRIQSGKGCISKDHTYMVLGSPEKLGEIQLNVPTKIGVLAEQTVCADVNLASDVKEGIKLTSNADEIIGAPVGVKSIEFRNTGSDTALGSDSLPLTFNETSHKYSGSAQVCVTGNEFYASAKKAKGLQITGESTLDPLRKSKTQTINLESCGIHPFDLVSQLQSKGPGDYYFSPGWLGGTGALGADAGSDNGNQNEVPMSKIINAMNDSNLSKNGTLLTGPGADKGKNAAYSDAAKSQRVKSILGFSWQNGFSVNPNPTKSYLPACMAVSLVCNGVGARFWGPMFDCVIPAMWSIAPDVGGLKQAREFMEKAAGQYIGPIVGKITELFDADSGNLTPDQQAIFNDLQNSAVGGVGAKTLLRAIPVKFNWLNYKTTTRVWASTAAADFSSQIADQVAKEQLSFTSIGARSELRNAIKGELEPAIKEALAQKESRGFFKFGTKGITLKELDAAADDAIKAAIDKTAPALDKRLFDLAIKNGYKTLPKGFGSEQVRTALVEKLGAGGIASSFTDADLPTIASGIANRMESEITSLGGTVSAADKVAFKNTATSALTQYKTIPRKKGINNLSVEAYKKIYSDLASSVPDATLKKIGVNLEKDAGGFAKKLLEGKTADLSGFKKFRKFAVNLGRGILCGTAANAAGEWAWKNGLAENPVNVPTEQVVGTPQVGPDGKPLVNANGDLQKDAILKKGKLYRATIKETTVNGQPQRTWAIDEVNPKDVPAKANYLTSDCDGTYATKPLDPKLFVKYGSSNEIPAPSRPAGNQAPSNPSSTPNPTGANPNGSPAPTPPR